jgi:hypothetical protein
MALANSHGGYDERIDRTIKEEEVDLSEHEHYTDAVFQLGLMFAEIGLPRIASQVVSTLAKFESQWLTRSLEEGGL